MFGTPELVPSSISTTALPYESSFSTEYSGLKSSYSSESSSSDNAPDGSAENNLARRRRPSHRPRGCRGGKRNKKKQQQQTQQLFGQMTTMPDMALISSTTETSCNIFASMAAADVTNDTDCRFQDQVQPADMTNHEDDDDDSDFLSVGILPPPIVGNETAPPILQGPNPYALTPAIQEWSIFDDQHRNTRIEKQRQMLSDGGSLFLISPRSFLLKGAERHQHTLWCN